MHNVITARALPSFAVLLSDRRAFTASTRKDGCRLNWWCSPLSGLGSSVAVHWELHVLADPVCFRWCFTLSGLTYLSGVKKQPSQGIDISHRQLWNVFTEGPETFKDKFGSDFAKLPSSSPDILFSFLFVCAVNKKKMLLFPAFYILASVLCIIDSSNVWLMADKLERYTTNPLWFPAFPPSSFHLNSLKRGHMSN